MFPPSSITDQTTLTSKRWVKRVTFLNVSTKPGRKNKNLMGNTNTERLMYSKRIQNFI